MRCAGCADDAMGDTEEREKEPVTTWRWKLRDMGSAKGISVAARTTIVRDAVAKRAPQLRQQPRGGILATVLVIWLLWTLAGWHGRSPALHMGDWSLGPPEIANATLGFQKIFVVNLPSRTDRRDAMTLAAAVSDLDFTWIDGVDGKDVLSKVLPAGDRDNSTKFLGNIGSWRAHMNALRAIVDQNLATALILEDDVDWDVRLKAQLQDFALASRAFLQPLTHHRSIFSSILSSTLPPSLSNLFTPPTLHVPPISKPVSAATMGSPLDDLRQLAPYTTVNITLPLHRRSSHALPSTVPPKTSPYGDDWDVLWLGHCGTELPTALAPRFREPDAAHPILPSSLLRLALSPDFTVPDPTFLRPHPFANQDPMSSLFAPHTRVLHLAGEGTACSLAYAVSQRGARRMLARYGGAGWGRLDKGWDLAMADWCGGFGTDEDVGPAGEKLPDEDSLRSEQEWEAVMARLAREEALAREQEKANGTTNATATTTTTRVRPTGTLTVPAPEMSVDPFEIALAEPSRPSETGGIMYGLSGGSAVRQMATAGDGSGGGAELGRPVPRWKPRPPPVCLTVQPPLINHHLRAGTQGGSDIQGVGGGFVEDISRTPYVRRSVMMNLRMMLDLDFGRRFSGSVRDEVVRKGGMRRAQVVDPRWEMLTEQYPDPPPPISFDDPSLNATETATTTVTGTATATATGTKTTTVDAATTASSGRGSLRAWFNRGRKTH